MTAEQAANHGVELVDFETLLARADVVTVHVPLTRATRGLIGREAIARLQARVDRPQRRPRRRSSTRPPSPRRSRPATSAAPASTSSRHEPPTDSPAARRAEHAADAAPRRLDRGGPGPRRRGGRGPGPRRPRRAERPLRRQRPAAHAGDGPGDRAVPAAGRDPRPVLRPVLARRRAHADPRDRRRAGRARRLAADRGGPARPARDRRRPSGSTSSTPARWPRPAGITVVERKTPDAGAFAAQLTLSADAPATAPLTVAGTVAGGEPRITRLDDYRLDMAPADVMLITRHHDRPGMVGRIGAMLGEADVNISAMHLARTRPREDALMILALDDDVPPAVAEAIRGHDAVLDLWTIRLGERALSAAALDPRRPRRDARPRPPRRVRVHRRGPLPGPGRHAR